MAEQDQCAYPGCTETERLHDLTPFDWADGMGSISTCNEHYDAIAQELLADGHILDSDKKYGE